MSAASEDSRFASSYPSPRRPSVGASIADLRRRFLDGRVQPDEAVARPILRSWQRCAALGLDMGTGPRIEPIARHELRERTERSRALLAGARAEIAALHHDARASDGIVILTDADGLVLDTVGSTDFAEKAARVALRPGVSWHEATTGTNAIGTAIAERREISVIGGEHWFEDHRILSCSAMPIFGPRGEIVGVLDLSNPSAVQHTHTLALVRRAVDAIERRLFEADAHDWEVVRFHTDPTQLGSPREGLLAFEGDRLVAANRHGLALVERGWDAVGATRFSEVFASGRARLGSEERLRTLTGRTLFADPRRRRAEVPVPSRRTERPSRPIEDGRQMTVATGALARSTTVATSAAVPRAAVETLWDDRVRTALTRATRLVDADVPVLVQGETGAGKEVFARALHAASRRADRPFVAVNCAALPEGLIEAELFGYDEGAFTGARKTGSKGLLREADGGVLFLDEIGDMPLALQARLLRALQEREVTPLGGGRPVPVEFALVCATHRGLAQMVEAKSFRQDLYFRIAQYTVELDPLRGRADLAEVIERLWAGLDTQALGVRLAPEAVACLAAYDWPGNWRQLTTTLRTLMVLAEPGETLGLDALPADIRRRVAGGHAPAPTAGGAHDGARDDGAAITVPLVQGEAGLDAITLTAMRAALDACDGNVTAAARRLGVHRSTLYRRLLDREGGRA